MSDDDDGLILAVPSKGRLEEETRRVFSESRLPITRPGGARSYSGAIKNQPGVAVRFYPAAEIARGLIMGAIDIGVTGSDLIYETAENGEGKVVMVKPLNFGQADVVVAVPDAWIDVTHMVDLADVASDFRLRHGRWLRVATKYAQLTRGFFAHNGIADYRIVPSAGATEAAPAAGTAEVIVDITTTGATLRDNGLKVLDDGVMLKSQTQLAASLSADWTGEVRGACEKLLGKLDPANPLYAGLAAQLPA